MQIVLYDNDLSRKKLYPLALTRPVSNLRVGILTIDEKWRKYFNTPVSFLTKDYLNKKFPLAVFSDSVLIIRGDILPDEALVEVLHNLKCGEALISSEEVLAFKTNVSESAEILSFHFDFLDSKDYSPVSYSEMIDRITFPEDIFRNNGDEIKKDFKLITKGRTSAP